MNYLKNAPWLLVVSVLMCSGCGLFGKSKHEIYLDSERGKSLQVPPDLSSPLRRDAMQIAEGPSPKQSISDQPVSDIKPTADDITEKLFIDAEPALAFQRVREALEQAQIGTLGAIDEGARRIAIKVLVETTKKRKLRKDRTDRNSFDRVTVVVADGSKSRVLVEDPSGNPVDDAASKKILAAIRERVVD